MNNKVSNMINELYADAISIFEYYKQIQSKNEIKKSLEYKKMLSYTKKFDLTIQTVSDLSNIKNKTKSANLISTINFFTTKVTSENIVKLLVAYSIFYMIARNDGHKRIGFDFEFNEGKIALWQVAFYSKTPNFKDQGMCYIFVIDPYIFDNECSQYKHLIIETLFLSPIKKILHGADSLDLPYIFGELFNKNKSMIQNFISNMSDTRFLCEYVKIVNNEGNKKCSIYDALLYFDVISQLEYNDLNKLTISMGPVQDVNWNLYKMSSYHLKYTMYDVLFLEKFVKNIYAKYLEKYPFNREDAKSELNLVSQINRLCFYEKYELTNILIESKAVVDIINNYFIVTNDSQLKLIDIYESTMQSLSVSNKLSHFLKTIEINNFKRFITTILKRIIYVLVLETHAVYENKKTIYEAKHSYINIFDKLLKFKLPNLAIKIIEFTDEAKEIIGKIVN